MILSTFFLILSDQAPDQLVLHVGPHVGIAALVVGQAGDVNVVALAHSRHVGDQVCAGLVSEKFSGRKRGVAARLDFDLLGRGDDDFLRHVAHHFVHHDEDRAAILLGSS